MVASNGDYQWCLTNDGYVMLARPLPGYLANTSEQCCDSCRAANQLAHFSGECYPIAPFYTATWRRLIPSEDLQDVGSQSYRVGY